MVNIQILRWPVRPVRRVVAEKGKKGGIFPFHKISLLLALMRAFAGSEVFDCAPPILLNQSYTSDHFGSGCAISGAALPWIAAICFSAAATEAASG